MQRVAPPRLQTFHEVGRAGRHRFVAVRDRQRDRVAGQTVCSGMAAGRDAGRADARGARKHTPMGCVAARFRGQFGRGFLGGLHLFTGSLCQFRTFNDLLDRLVHGGHGFRGLGLDVADQTRDFRCGLTR